VQVLPAFEFVMVVVIEVVEEISSELGVWPEDLVGLRR